jgi:uncharacterized membrane protein YkvA (DUF1232 family)
MKIYDWYRQTIRNPKYRWWIIAGTLIYIISPIDLLPDLVPFIGEVDDVLLFTLLLTEVSQWLIERLKVSKSTVSPDATVASASGTVVESTPVDVDAVSID